MPALAVSTVADPVDPLCGGAQSGAASHNPKGASRRPFKNPKTDTTHACNYLKNPYISIIKEFHAPRVPFVEVDDVDIAFGGIPNYGDVLQACPEDFYRDNNPFSRLASRWFAIGQLDPSTDLAGYELTAETREDAIGQRRYIQAWLGSFEPKHEDKIAVGGWLLSIMLRPEQAEAEVNAMAAKIRDQITERRAKIELLHGDNIFSQYAAQFPELRDATIRLYEEEVEAFSALDPITATDQDILEIINTYHLLREELAPNISSYNQSDEDGQP